MKNAKRFNNKNYRTQQSKNRLSDRDILLDLLVTEKSMAHLYDHAIMESSGDEIRDVFEEFQHDEHENGYILYQAMQQRGWYGGESTVQRSKPFKYRVNNRSNSEYAMQSGSRNFGSALNRSHQYQSGDYNSRYVNNNSFV